MTITTERVAAGPVTAMLPIPMQASPPPSPAALSLLRQAELGLYEAERTSDACRRYVAAHLAALRAGASVLAVRAHPAGRARSGRSVWQLLPSVAPELSEWAAFFAACSSTRSMAEAGVSRAVTDRSADDLVRQAGHFLQVSRAVVCSR